MASTDLDYYSIVEPTFDGWTDHRLLSLDEAAAMVWYFVYGQNVFSQFGRDWTGCSFRQDETSCLLVSRSTIDGRRQVAFTTGRTPTDCVRVFCRRFRAGEVEWYDDKYG